MQCNLKCTTYFGKIIFVIEQKLKVFNVKKIYDLQCFLIQKDYRILHKTIMILQSDTFIAQWQYFFNLVRESIFWGITIFCPLNSIITSLNLIWMCVTESKLSKWLSAARANMRVMLTQTQTNDTFVPRVICTLRRKRERERDTLPGPSLALSLSVTTSPAKWRGKTTNHSQICCCCSTAYQRVSPAWPRQYWRVMAVCYMIAFFIFSLSLTFLFAPFYSSSYRPLRSNQHGGPKQKRDCLFNWEQHCITAFFPTSPLY